MDRAGIGTGTRKIALTAVERTDCPTATPAELVRELYDAENGAKPSRPARRT